jgi:hypothetical protein
LRFFINNDLRGSWSGVTAWGLEGVYLPAGTHRIVFEYIKDSSPPSGSDRVWIDNVAFPPIVGFVKYPPRNFVATNSGRDITLNWSPPFQTTLPDPPDMLSYNVYQSGVVIANLNTTTYSIINSGGGPNMNFHITAVYDQQNGESPPSNGQNISIPYAVPHDLAATMLENGVKLTWAYDFDTTNLRGFRVYRNGINLTSGNPVPPNIMWYLDDTAIIGESYSYDARALYQNPNGVSGPSIPLDIVYVSEADELIQPLTTRLFANYPNPFNPETTIAFTVGSIYISSESSRHTASHTGVRIEIYNIRGQLVRELLNAELTSGVYNVVWDGTDDDGRDVGSGVYFYRMTSGDFSATNKMLLIK